jgi:hypothetical protein
MIARAARSPRPVFGLLLALACGQSESPPSAAPAPVDSALAKYTTVRLTIDTAALTAAERRMLPLLIEAAQEMDSVFWHQAWGGRDSLLARVSDPAMRRFVEINYGPWDRLAGDEPFITEIGSKPEGANFYPRDVTRAEFDSALAAGPAAYADSLRSLYTLVRRGERGRLVAVPYHVEYASHHRAAAAKLRDAATLAEDAGLKRYLQLRAAALETDEYQTSDLAWMDMKSNTIDFIVGPIETYEDLLYGYKAAHEAYVLVKDQAWSSRLSRYAALLPGLQRGLPVPDAYKRERPGSESELNAYDVIYYAGQANAGSKTIAINLPNDEEVQLRKGTRRLQLKNAMRAKFDQILVPIARELVAADQLSLVTFDAFFENVMFHEVAHGLGVKNTITGKGTVREALKERASAYEEGKADILGLYMIEQLARQNEVATADMADNYVTFLASLFRSIRFGASSAHGRANVVAFNFLEEQDAFTRDVASGTYRVNLTKFGSVAHELARRILQLQGDGDYEGAQAFADRYGSIGPQLQQDLDRLGSKGIPVDIVFEQGLDVLGLKR